MVPSLRDRHRRLGEQFEQERLELVVGTVDLVDQQDTRAVARGAGWRRAAGAHEVVGAEQVVSSRSSP
jgi:hypothetical protein